jgi:DNA-directed RNA polymerase subunit RPC12/RpoP
MSYTSSWTLTDDCRCPKCFGKVEFIEWESDNGTHEDTRYRCLACNHTWHSWLRTRRVEGPDA